MVIGCCGENAAGMVMATMQYVTIRWSQQIRRDGHIATSARHRGRGAGIEKGRGAEMKKGTFIFEKWHFYYQKMDTFLRKTSVSLRKKENLRKRAPFYDLHPRKICTP